MKWNVFGAIDRLYRAVCAALMGLMALTVILSVFFRYVFSLTTVWSEELISVLFIATTFLGSAMVARDDEHIEIDFLFGVLPKRAAAALRLLVSFIVIAVMVIVFRSSLSWIAVSGELRTSGLEIPFKWLYALLPVCCVLTCIVEAGKAYRRARLLFDSEGLK